MPTRMCGQVSFPISFQEVLVWKKCSVWSSTIFFVLMKNTGMIESDPMITCTSSEMRYPSTTG